MDFLPLKHLPRAYDLAEEYLEDIVASDWDRCFIGGEGEDPDHPPTGHRSN
ncbi:MAG: hypothetical protein AAF655_24865 [Bacteroidota bacterium]